MARFKLALFTTTLLIGGAGIGLAQFADAQTAPAGTPTVQTGPTYDPSQLPSVQGKVAEYTLTPRGDVDGLILDNGTEVHLSPRLSTQLVFAVHPGDSVTIHGLKARALPMVAGASVTNDATHVTVTNFGQRGHERAAPIEDSGKIKAQLHEPRGEVNGVLLEDGTAVRLPAPEAHRLADQLAVGQTLFVRGVGVVSPLGKLIMARQIGTDASKLTNVMGPRMRDGMFARGLPMRGPRPGMPKRGPGPDHGPGHGPATPPPPPPPG